MHQLYWETDNKMSYRLTATELTSVILIDRKQKIHKDKLQTIPIDIL